MTLLEIFAVRMAEAAYEASRDPGDPRWSDLPARERMKWRLAAEMAQEDRIADGP